MHTVDARSIDGWWASHRDTLRTGKSLHIDVYFRSYTPLSGGHDRRQTLMKTLTLARNRGIIEDYDVTLLGSELCLCPTCSEYFRETGHLDTAVDLSSWQLGTLQSNGFRKRTVDSSLTDEQYRVIVPPETVVAVSLDSSRTGVFPCDVDGESYDVGSFLADFRRHFELDHSREQNEPPSRITAAHGTTN